MSIGALIGSPVSGAALDKFGPWVPLSVTAGACAAGCLWRGMAEVSRGIIFIFKCHLLHFISLHLTDLLAVAVITLDGCDTARRRG